MNKSGKSLAARLCLTSALVAASLSAKAASAQSPGPSLWSIDTIFSQTLGEKRVVLISLPPEHHEALAAPDSFPLVIVLDAQGDRRFPFVVAAGRMLSNRPAPDIPPCIIVGVETLENRLQDTTPPGLEDAGRIDRNRADMFAKFISTELIPLLRSRYRTAPYSVVVGHSMTGLFSAYYYGYSAPPVSAAISLSPSLWVKNGRAYDVVLSGIRGRSAPGRLFFGVGDMEGSKIPPITARLIEELREGTVVNTTIGFRRFPKASHSTTWFDGVVSGMRYVFEPVSLAGHPLEPISDSAPDTAIISAFSRMRAAYAEGSRELGLRDALPRPFARYLVQYYNGLERFRVAVRICEDLVRSYATDWYGYECLGDAQQNLNDRAAAVASYKSALRLARAAGAGAAAAVASLEQKVQSHR
jgi:uncharacterized protein